MIRQKQLIEKGIVKYIHGNHAAVELIKQSSELCKSCTVCIGIESKTKLLEVPIISNLKAGQKVLVQIPEPSPYKSIVLLLILPIASLLLGSYMGQKLYFIYPHSQDIRMALCGFLCFLLSITSLRIYEKKVKHLRRRIVSIDMPDNFHSVAN